MRRDQRPAAYRGLTLGVAHAGNLAFHTSVNRHLSSTGLPEPAAGVQVVRTMWPQAGEKVAARCTIVTFRSVPRGNLFGFPRPLRALTEPDLPKGSSVKAAPVLATAAILAAAGLVIHLTMAARTHLEPNAGHAAVMRTSAVVTPAGGSPAMAGSPALAAGTAKATARSAATRPSATRTMPSATRTTPTVTQATPTASGGAPLAGRIVPGATYHGVATAYSAGDGDGACLLGRPLTS